MTITIEHEIERNGKKVRVTKVLSDSLGLFGPSIINTGRTPLYILEDDEIVLREHPYQLNKRYPGVENDKR